VTQAIRRAVGVLVVALAAAGCLPRAVGPEAREIASIYTIFLVAAAVVAAIVLGSTTWAIIRYRVRGQDAPPRQVRGNVRAETIWTLLPAVTVAGLFALTVVTLVRIESTEAAPGVEVEVSGFRWGWTFRYPADDVTVSGIGEPGPEIVVPLGEPVRFRITAVDVVHSFYVPHFLQKRDATPGRETVMQVTIDEPGTYRGQCAEYCGIRHWRMPFAVRAVPRPDYETWLAAQPRGGAPAASAPATPGTSPAP
jgi:cytochrome c oxidase subunit 2